MLKVLLVPNFSSGLIKYLCLYQSSQPVSYISPLSLSLDKLCSGHTDNHMGKLNMDEFKTLKYHLKDTDKIQ